MESSTLINSSVFVTLIYYVRYSGSQSKRGISSNHSSIDTEAKSKNLRSKAEKIFLKRLQLRKSKGDILRVETILTWQYEQSWQTHSAFTQFLKREKLFSLCLQHLHIKTSKWLLHTEIYLLCLIESKTFNPCPFQIARLLDVVETPENASKFQ